MILDLDPSEMDEVRLALHVYRELIVQRSSAVSRRVVSESLESAIGKVQEAIAERRRGPRPPAPGELLPIACPSCGLSRTGIMIDHFKVGRDRIAGRCSACGWPAPEPAPAS